MIDRLARLFRGLFTLGLSFTRDARFLLALGAGLFIALLLGKSLEVLLRDLGEDRRRKASDEIAESRRVTGILDPVPNRIRTQL